MAVKVKIDGAARDFSVMVSDLLLPASQSKAIADFAREQIAIGDDNNRRVLGRRPPRTITVDGSLGKPLDAVRPVGGSVIVEWELIGDMLIEISRMLENRSPRQSGDYAKGHTLFADGVEVAITDRIPHADEYVFINLVPYARKIEVGKTNSGRDFVLQVPNRIYERTFKDAKARYGNQAKITLGYETQTGAYRLKKDQVKRSWNKKKHNWRISAKQSPDRVAGSAVSVPAIRISLRDR